MVIFRDMCRRGKGVRQHGIQLRGSEYGPGKMDFIQFKERFSGMMGLFLVLK